MTNKEFTNYVMLNNIMKEQNPQKRKHALDVFYYNRCQEKQREQNMAKRQK